ncbi:MAG: hypothetical protein GY940_11540 [bacterium]|nr:hypothetical protein [bacterium]
MHRNPGGRPLAFPGIAGNYHYRCLSPGSSKGNYISDVNVEMIVKQDGQGIVLPFNMVERGTWTLKGDLLTEKTGEIQLTPKTDNAASFLEENPEFEKSLKNDDTTIIKILNITKSSIEMEEQELKLKYTLVR